jgi:hypothetical protein
LTNELAYLNEARDELKKGQKDCTFTVDTFEFQRIVVEKGKYSTVCLICPE